MQKIFKTLQNNNIIDGDSLMIYEFFLKREISDEIGNLIKVKESSFGDKKVLYLKKEV